MNQQIKNAAAKAAAVVTKPFRRKTVASVVASVEAQVNELIHVATREAQRAAKSDAKADAFRTKAQNHRTEATKAVRVAGRFAALVK